MNSNDAAIQQYKEELPKLEQCKQIYLDVVSDILRDENTQSINARVKTVESYQNKLAKYKDGDPLLKKLPTDIIGIRIVTYFNEDSILVADKLSERFIIDRSNSVHKASLQSYDKFGYLSIHLIASFKDSELNEEIYQPCRDTCVEIQIRTVMQHAWAEIEHDIGYKSKYEIPTQMRRRFARLAGLLEIADNEFSELRKEAQRYELGGPRQADVEKHDSLAAADLTLFIMTNNEMINTRAEIKQDRSVFYTEHLIDPIGYYAVALPQIGIYDSETLENKLATYRADVVGYARTHYPGPGVAVRKPNALPFGYPINILIDLLTGRINSNTDKH